MYRSILVPLDGSKLGASVLPVAIHLARRHSAQLELITIEITRPTMVIGLSLHDVTAAGVKDQASEYLAEVAERIGEVYAAPVKQTVRRGYARAAPTLLEYAEEEGIDLIVLATHGYGPLKRFWLGSVADAIARESRIPTLLVRPEEDRKVDLHVEPTFKRILIALDGSAAAATILEHARSVGDQNAEYILLQAVPPVVPVGVGYALVPPADDYTSMSAAADDSYVRAQVEAAQNDLVRAAQSLEDRSLRVTTVVTEQAFAAPAILDYAEKNGVDLIALTTHGRGGAARLIVGSVADKVVRGARVPVLLYRPPAE